MTANIIYFNKKNNISNIKSVNQIGKTMNIIPYFLNNKWPFILPNNFINPQSIVNNIISNDYYKISKINENNLYISRAPNKYNESEYLTKEFVEDIFQKNLQQYGNKIFQSHPTHFLTPLFMPMHSNKYPVKHQTKPNVENPNLLPVAEVVAKKPTKKEYMKIQANNISRTALNRSFERDHPVYIKKNGEKTFFDWNQFYFLGIPFPASAGYNCIATATQNYVDAGDTYTFVSGNKTFNRNPQKYGFKKINNPVGGNLAQVKSNSIGSHPYHCMIYTGEQSDYTNNYLFNYSNGTDTYKKNGDYIDIRRERDGDLVADNLRLKYYNYIGSKPMRKQWRDEYKLLFKSK